MHEQLPNLSMYSLIHFIAYLNQKKVNKKIFVGPEKVVVPAATSQPLKNTQTKTNKTKAEGIEYYMNVHVEED